MAGRPRCAHCRRAFTPNYRNRTKTSGQQRVCADCGPLIGHRMANRRFKASLKEAERPPRRGTPSTIQKESPGGPPTSVPVVEGATHGLFVGELANRIRVNSVQMALALLGGDGCKGGSPLQVRIDAKSSRPFAC